MFPIACLRRLLSCQPFSLLATQATQVTQVTQATQATQATHATQTTRASEARRVVASLLEEL